MEEKYNWDAAIQRHFELEAEIKQLKTENERLKADLSALSDIAHKWDAFEAGCNKAMEAESEYKQALAIAADALDIAADWDVDNVQCNPPKEWRLPAYGEDPEDGWCSTSALAELLRNLVALHGEGGKK